MVDIKTIIEKVQNGLKSCSEQHQIPAKDVQLMILSSGIVNLKNADKEVGNIDVCKTFKISAIENMLFPIVPYLKKALASLATKKNVDPKTAVARIFTRQDDYYPCVYLQDGNRIIGEITIEELLNNK